MDDDRDRYRILEEERRRAQRAKEPGPERPTARPLSGSPHAVPLDSMGVMQPEIMRRLVEQEKAHAAELARDQKDDPAAKRRAAEAERTEQQRQAHNAQHEARRGGATPQTAGQAGPRQGDGKQGDAQAVGDRDAREARAQLLAEEAKLRLAHQMSLRRGRSL